MTSLRAPPEVKKNNELHLVQNVLELAEAQSEVRKVDIERENLN
jgi:hypothetical protein